MILSSGFLVSMIVGSMKYPTLQEQGKANHYWDIKQVVGYEMSSVFHRATRGERKNNIRQKQEEKFGLRERPGAFALVPHGFAACPRCSTLLSI